MDITKAVWRRERRETERRKRGYGRARARRGIGAGERSGEAGDAGEGSGTGLGQKGEGKGEGEGEAGVCRWRREGRGERGGCTEGEVLEPERQAAPEKGAKRQTMSEKGAGSGRQRRETEREWRQETGGHVQGEAPEPEKGAKRKAPEKRQKGEGGMRRIVFHDPKIRSLRFLRSSRFIDPSSPSPLPTSTAQIRSPSRIHVNSSKTAVSSADSGSFRIAVSSSVYDAEIQNEEHAEQKFTSDTKKKKKKPRPSFYEQTRQRWSIKIALASTRAKFPWVEAEPRSSESLPDIPLSSAPADSSTISAGEPSSGQKSRRFRGHNRMISAPWAHGPKLRNSHLNLRSGGLVDESVDGRAVGSVKNVESHEVAEKVESELEIHDATERIGGVGMGGDVISAPWMHGPKLGKLHLSSAVEDTALFHRAVHKGVDSEEAKNPIVIGKAEETPSGWKLAGIHLESEAEMHSATERNGCGKAEKSDVGIIVEKSKKLDMVVDRKERDSEPNDNDADSPNWNSRNLDNTGGIVDSSVHFGPGPVHDSTEEGRSNHYKNSDNLMNVMGNRDSIQLPWERERSPDGERWRKSNTALAEKTIHELHWSRNVSLRMKERMKKEEVVKTKFEGPPAVNMKRTHGILELEAEPYLLSVEVAFQVQCYCFLKGGAYDTFFPAVVIFFKELYVHEWVTIDVKARELSGADSMSALGWEPDKLEKMETAKDSGDDVTTRRWMKHDEGEESYLPTYNDSDDEDDEPDAEIDEPAHEREPI
ncbi:hypothetical protein ACLOJK_039960 [Asimina triloba]